MEWSAHRLYQCATLLVGQLILVVGHVWPSWVWTGPRDLESLKAYALEGAAEVAKAGTNSDEAAL
jgi:hypothetical protein